jgi:thymidylate kinase
MPALANDQLVFSDRGVESTVCYQSAAGTLSAELIMDISRMLLPPRYIQPDALALLSITKEVRRQRLDKRFEHTAADRMELKGDSFDDRVYEGYQALGRLDYVTTIDANRDEQEVFEALKPVVFDKYMEDHTGVFLPTYTNYNDTRKTQPASNGLK